MATRLNLFVMDAFPEQMSWRDFATAMSRSSSHFDKINDYDKYLKSAEWRTRYWQNMSEAHEADYTHSLNLGESAHPYYKQLKQYYEDLILTTRNNATVIRELDALEEKKINLEKSLQHVVPLPPHVTMPNVIENLRARIERQKQEALITKIEFALLQIEKVKANIQTLLIHSISFEDELTQIIDLMRGPHFNHNKITVYVGRLAKLLTIQQYDLDVFRDGMGNVARRIETVERATQLQGGSRKRATARSRKYKNKTRVSRK